MPQLKVVEVYRVGNEIKFIPGQIIDVTEQERLFYFNDAPGCFEDYEPEPAKPEVKEVSGPSVNKQVTRAPKSKSTKR